MFQTNFVQKIKTRILCSVTFFPENLAINEIRVMWKNTVEDNMAHAPSMVDN
jgi:hypothetical protein